ncbi:MAG TPA: stage III sporulation protein AF [Clostridia bacterium]|nr:stage III sporulation protein AF [Clostridia bacterium]
MIDILSEWVRSVTIILFLAFFLDMLIPNSSLKRYVHLVIGLFIIMIILNPLIRILDLESYDNISVFNSEDRKISRNIANLDKIIENGKQIQVIGTEQTKNVLETRLAYQIEGLCLVVDGIDKVKVKLNLESEVKPGELEKIANIFLEVTLKDGEQNKTSAELVEPVVINGREEVEEHVQGGEKYSIQSKKDIENKLKTILSSFYGIPKDKIIVSFDK